MIPTSTGMETPDGQPARRARARDLASVLFAWGVWAVLSVALVLFVKDNSLNIPYCDEFRMIPVMTGAPMSLDWAWSQHNEHRPMISRLIMAGLFRSIGRDFRVARYANAVVLSAMAAAMLILARRLRGSTRATDAVLPLSILNVAQGESLMIGFALNLILTSLVALVLIAAASIAHRGRGVLLTLGFGLSLVLLPLCGGSGITMLPPLALWLAGYLALGWWSGRRPARPIRLVGELLILASVAVVVLYLQGYTRPAGHPLPPSMGAVASATMMYLSLAIYPGDPSFWRPASLILVALVAATFVLLGIAARRAPDERPRAMALLAVIASMLCVALAVGVSRSGLAPGTTLAGRYVTLTFPLLCTLHVAWLIYGRGRTRSAVHLGLVVLLVLAFPGGLNSSRVYLTHIREVELQVERDLKAHVPAAELIGRACPVLLIDPKPARHWFRLLKEARVGAFAEFDVDRVATTPDEAIGPVRR